jgi:stage IV sporulation protein A
MALNCEQLGSSEIQSVFEQFLLEFPLTRIVFQVPKWTETLENTHWLKQDLFQSVKKLMQTMHTVRDIYDQPLELDSKYVKKTKMEQVDLASGDAEVTVQMPDSLYYEILSEMTGADIRSEYQLISIVREMSRLKQEYMEVSAAMSSVKQTGYGIITPGKSEIQMEEPVIIKQGSKYGVKIRANAPSIHLIRADIETELSPIVGSESQAQDLITYMKESGNALIFGKSVDEMVEEGIRTRLASVTEESQQKLQDAMKRIVNDSNGRLICIIL